MGILNCTLSLLKLSWLQCSSAELQHGIMLYKVTAQTVSCNLSNPSTWCSWHNSSTCHCQLETMHSTNRITVDVVTRLQAGCPRNCASIPSIENRVSSSTKCQDRLWHPHSLLFHGHNGYYQRHKEANAICLHGTPMDNITFTLTTLWQWLQWSTY